MLVAIPTDSPGGLEAPVSAHFGHCHSFTLVQTKEGEVGEVRVLPNEGHDQGSCMTPVNLLRDQGVEALVAGGMGGRPLAGFQEVGIAVYHQEEPTTARQAVERLLEGALPQFEPACSCGGHHESDTDEQGPDRPEIEGPATVQKGRVVRLDFQLFDTEGRLLDTTEKTEPLAYLHGHGQFLPGLETELEGREAGDCLKVTLEPEQAYGPRRPDRVFEVPRDRMPEGIEVGSVLKAPQPGGAVALLLVVDLDEETATVDANHPLAGRTLVFDLTVCEVLAATEQELEAGRAI